MTAVDEQVNVKATDDKTIEVFISLNPVIALNIDAEEAAAPGAGAGYAQYGSRYLDAVEKFVTENSVPNLHIFGEAHLMADDEDFQVDIFATLTFRAGSETDRFLQQYHEANDEAKEQFQYDNATRVFNDHLAKYIAGLVRECGYHFRFGADYRW